MPTYEYECRDCAHRFDVFHAMSESPVSECPQCRGGIRRMVSGGAGLIFRGSGFYATDYAAKPCGGCANEPACAAAREDGCGEKPPCAD